MHYLQLVISSTQLHTHKRNLTHVGQIADVFYSQKADQQEIETDRKPRSTIVIVLSFDVIREMIEVGQGTVVRNLFAIAGCVLTSTLNELCASFPANHRH